MDKTIATDTVQARANPCVGGILACANPTTSETLLKDVARDAVSPCAAEFVRIYEPLLKRYVATFASSGSPIQSFDQKDIVQDAILSVMAALPAFKYDRAKGSFRGYLKVAAKNAVLAFRLARKRTIEISCPNETLEAIAVRDREMATQESDPESPMLKAWSLSLAHVLRKSRCAPNTRAVFRRLVTEGTSADDVAAEFNITANNVYQIKNRFLRAVKKDLAAVMATLPPGSRTVEDLCEALERRED